MRFVGIVMMKIIFIVVGSLIKRKDPITIINAFINANIEDKEILVLLGDGELIEQCKNESDNNIILKGNVKNVSDFLKVSDKLIQSLTVHDIENADSTFIMGEIMSIMVKYKIMDSEQDETKRFHKLIQHELKSKIARGIDSG